MVLFNLYLGDEEVPTFPKDISLKMNVKLKVEFEFAYQDVEVERINHYATGTQSSTRKIDFQ